MSCMAAHRIDAVEAIRLQLSQVRARVRRKAGIAYCTRKLLSEQKSARFREVSSGPAASVSFGILEKGHAAVPFHRRSIART